MSATMTPPPMPAAQTAPITAGAMVPAADLYRFTVEQCEAMVAAGVFGDKAPVELIEGLFLVKPVEEPPHITCSDLLRAALGAALPAGWYARWDHPIRLATSIPEP
ncbi:MAG: hypothetical protein K2W96_15980, partial [Gemmataceae bacterium]|nr:hypothetical protein [Gemmataceae bacterium]